MNSEEILEDELVTNSSFVDGGFTSLLGEFNNNGFSSSTAYHSQAHEPATLSCPQAAPPPPSKRRALIPVPLLSQRQPYQKHEPLITASSSTAKQHEHLVVSRSSSHQSHEPLTTKPIPYAISVVTFLRSLFAVSSEDIASERFLRLTAVIVNIVKNLNELEIEGLKAGLIDHVGLYEDRYPWVDLEAAYLLNLNYDLLWKPDVPRPSPSSLKICPKVRTALQDGRYIPMQHILHCLSIFQFQPDIETYPFKVTEPVPYEFVNKIKRADVIRGANIHCILMGLKFPLIAVNYPSLIDELWSFMFVGKFSAMAGMELYNEFFFDFSRQLGQGVVPSISHIPSHITENISRKFI